MLSLLAVECFGGASFGTVFGLLSVFVMAGSAFGPWLAGTLADSSGGYTLPFTLSGAVALAMGALVLAARRPAAVESHPRAVR